MSPELITAIAARVVYHQAGALARARRPRTLRKRSPVEIDKGVLIEETEPEVLNLGPVRVNGIAGNRRSAEDSQG